MPSLVCPDWLFTGTELLRDHGFAVEKGRITDVAPQKELQARHPGAAVRRLEDQLVTPAFVDAHDHGRGVSPISFGAPDRALELWIPTLSRVSSSPYEAAFYEGLLLASAGVGTVLHSHNPCAWETLEQELVDTARGYNDAGIRVVLCPPYVEQNSLVYHRREQFAAGLSGALRAEFEGAVLDQPFPLEDYFALVESLQSRLAEPIKAGLVDIQLHPSGGQWCGDEALKEMNRYAEAKDMRIHMHMLETRYQASYAKQRWNKSFVEHLSDIGLLGPRLSLAHMVWIDHRDIWLLAETGTRVVTNPSSNLRLRSGVAPLQALREGGVTCGIGLDGCALDDDQDYVREMRLAWYNPGAAGVRAGIAPEQVLAMGTMGGAAATGPALSQGRIAPGVPADFAAAPLAALRAPYTAPSGIDPVSLLLARGTRRAVDTVVIGGEVVVEKGSPTRGDLAGAAARLEEKITEARQGGAPGHMSEELLAAMADFYAGWEERT